MKYEQKINRRKFLTLASKFCAVPFLPYSSFYFSKNDVVKKDSNTIETPIIKDKFPNIKVIGVGGAGGNTIKHMIDSKLQGINFIDACNNLQSLEISKAPVKILIGERLTPGFVADPNPQIGRQAALKNAKTIRSALAGSDMVFITAGLGGETGAGAAPVIAEICKEIKALTVAVVLKPFSFEGEQRIMQAEQGIHALQEVADAVVAIPNDLLRGLVSKNEKMVEAFKRLDEMQLHLIKGITDLIRIPGLVSIDFADIQTIMSKSGMAKMGTGNANGKNRVVKAVKMAISHPLMKDISIANAKGVVMNITGDGNLRMEEMTQAVDQIYKEAGNNTDIVWGSVIDKNLKNCCNVTVVATGIG